MKTQTRPSTGIITVKVPTPSGVRVISTGCTDPKEAKQVLKSVNIRKVVALSKAGQLTRQLIQKLTINGNIGLQEALDEWARWLTETANSDRTSDTQITAVKAWARDSGVLKHKLHTVTAPQISKWINSDEDVKLGTRRVRLASVRSFFRYCAIRDYINPDPSREVRVKAKGLTHEQKETKEKVLFTTEEYQTLTRHIASELVTLMGLGHTTARLHKAQVLTFWSCAVVIGRYSGLRLGDIACLEWGSISAGKLIVHTDKSDARVELPVGPQLQAGLSAIPVRDMKYCFPEQRAINNDVRRRSLLSIQFARLLDACQLGQHCFHDLRHTLATELHVKGSSLEQIAEALGHSNTRTTEIYVHA